MPAARIHVVGPPQLGDFLQAAPLNEAMKDVAGLAGAELSFGRPDDGAAALPDLLELPIRHDGRPAGRVLYTRDGPRLEQAARAMSRVLEHMAGREAAVEDLAGALMNGYEELNVIYALLPAIATQIHESQIAEVLVDRAAETLQCGRVSLLLIDEERRNFKVLASRGLPAEVLNLTIPIVGTVAEQALMDNDMLVVNDSLWRPELTRLSRGRYDSDCFVVVRVPLRAQGQAVGVLSVTEKENGAEFTARDRKLLEGLSAMGASALLNCRLHASLDKQMMSTIEALACAVDAKDQYTHDHSGRVSRLCLAMAGKLGKPSEASRREIELGGLLHDIGKIGIPDAILSKPGGLVPEEFAVIRTHVKIGSDIVSRVRGLEPVARAILHHHERYDGLGYPGGLARDEIPLASMLIAAADTFDSLTSDRPYRKATSDEHALREIHRCKGTQFDPAVTAALTAVIEEEAASPKSA
jgi:putative nucleotidyltransferase with HDIG domain